MYSSLSEDDRPTSGERYSSKPRCQAVEPGRVGPYEVEDGQERLAQGPCMAAFSQRAPAAVREVVSAPESGELARVLVGKGSMQR